jgi:hypothetical protein
MKKLMQTSLAAMLLAGVVLTASAQATTGKKSQEIGQKIGNEVMEEVMKEAQSSGKAPSADVVGKKMIEKMRANLDDLKKAGTEDCTELYGQDKASNCQCVTDKTDYDVVFAMMEKQMANPQAQPGEELKALEAKTEENYKACDLDIKVMKDATEKAMKEVTGKKG